jgi:hypothetical protein
LADIPPNRRDQARATVKSPPLFFFAADEDQKPGSLATSSRPHSARMAFDRTQTTPPHP